MSNSFFESYILTFVFQSLLEMKDSSKEHLIFLSVTILSPQNCIHFSCVYHGEYLGEL